MHNATDTLSRAATAIALEMEAQSQAWDDHDVHEVADLIARAHERSLQALAQRYGFGSYDALIDAIERRTTARWVHFHLPL